MRSMDAREHLYQMSISMKKNHVKPHVFVLGQYSPTILKNVLILALQIFPGFCIPALTQITFQSYRLLFSHASAEVGGENTPERNVAATGSRTRNHKS